MSASTTTTSSEQLGGSSLSQFFTTLSVSAAIAAIEIIIFVIIRTIFKRIYEPKTYLGDESRRVEPLPRSFYGWLPTLLKMPQEDLIRTSGLDAYFFARYLYVHSFFFLSSFVVLSVILLPIYAINGKGEAYGKTGLDILTFGNISPHHTLRYIAPLILAYVFIGAFLYLLYSEMKAFVEKRQAFLRSSTYQSSASATTILVTAIPKTYMSEDVLLRIFNQFPGGVKRIWLNRNLKDLPDKANKRAELVGKLEAAECKLIKTALKVDAKRKNKQNSINPELIEENIEQRVIDKYIPENKRPKMRIGPIPLLSSLCFGQKVDTITYCTEMIAKLNNEIESSRATQENYVVSNSAFIQFNKQIAAHMAVQSVIASRPLIMTPRYLNIKPTTIVWSNLRLSYYELKIRQLLALTATIALIVFWAIPVAFVGVLSNLTYLTNKVTFLRFIYNLPNFLIGLITGLLPTVLLAILMALLPIVLTLFARISGIPTADGIDRSVQASYFVFQVVHVFLVVTISSSVTSVITTIFDHPASAATILASNIPTASNFFFSFIALEGLSVASGVLLQIVTLILFYLLGKLFDSTPRKIWQRYSTLETLSWGTLFPVFTNLVVISIVYSIITPLVLIISGLAFGLFYIAYIYVLFYVTDIQNDTGGLAFPRAISQSFTGVYLMEVMLAGLFFLVQDESGAHSSTIEGAFICILIAITIVVQLTMKSSFNSLIDYLPADAEELSSLDISASQATSWLKKATKVINPVKTKITNDTIIRINNAVNEQYDNTMDNAYLHPSIRDPKPTIWIPSDYLGIATDEMQRINNSGLDIQVTNENARFNNKMKIEVDGPPFDNF